LKTFDALHSCQSLILAHPMRFPENTPETQETLDQNGAPAYIAKAFSLHRRLDDCHFLRPEQSNILKNDIRHICWNFWNGICTEIWELQRFHKFNCVSKPSTVPLMKVCTLHSGY